MIPITGLIITPSDEPQPLDTPIFELNNYTLNQVFTDNAITWNDFKDSEQLVTNGDFSDGTTGWNSENGTLINDGGKVKITSTVSSDNYKISQTVTTIIQPSNKYYLSTTINQAQLSSGSGLLYLNTNLGAYIITAPNTVGEQFVSGVVMVDSGIVTVAYYEIRYNAINIGNYFTVDNAYLFNISTLITNKQYSPLYSTTFDLMSDAEIKTQMDDFVTTGEASPNQINIWMTYTALGLTNLTKDQMEHYYALFLYYSSL